MPDRADLDLLTQAQRNAVAQATAELDGFFDRAKGWSADEVAAGVSDLMTALVRRYGDAAATAAAEWYERLRAAEIGGSYEALLANPLPARQVESTVRALNRGLYGADADWTQVRANLTGALQRYVAEQVRSTIERNALKDKAARRFARVPQGRTCAFCAMLASRGFAYTSAKAAGEAHAYHDHCDCLVVPAFGRTDPVIDGYDPAALSARYDEARRVVEKSGKPATPQNIAATMRQLHPEEYTDGAGVRRSGKRKPKTQSGQSGSGAGRKPPRRASQTADNGDRPRRRGSGSSPDGSLRHDAYERHRLAAEERRPDGGEGMLTPPKEPPQPPPDWPDDLPALTSRRLAHLLYGYGGGGGHLAGFGWLSGGSEFPDSWDEQHIVDAIRAVLIRHPEPDSVIIDSYDGIEMTVVVHRGEVATSHPGRPRTRGRPRKRKEAP